jgi:hypothetical protein
LRAIIGIVIQPLWEDNVLKYKRLGAFVDESRSSECLFQVAMKEEIVLI